MHNRFSLENRVGVVTGGAFGLGRAIAEALVEAGAKAILLDIDHKAAETTAAEIGPAAEARALDVADRAALRATFAAIQADHGQVDAVFANAGMSSGRGYLDPTGQIGAVQDEIWDQVLEVNLTSVFTTVQAAAEIMGHQGRGSIVTISSVAGLKSEPLVGYAYASTKAAVINLTRHAAMEFATKGVRVNGIAPGPFRTNIAGGRINLPEVEAAFAADVPMGRIAEPDEIKGLAVYLASDASSFMTGVTIPLDGGMSVC